MDALLEEFRALRSEGRAERAEAAAALAAVRSEAAAARAEAREQAAALRAEIALLREGKVQSPSAPSYASVGQEALEALAARRSISAAAAPPEGAADAAPVATAEELERLHVCGTENELIVAITPLLRAARGLGGDGAGAVANSCARVLVNSENAPWLDSLHAPLPANQLKRPDLFVTWAPLWSGRYEAARGPVGRLAARALQLDGCAREFYEAKLGSGELTAADFGQLVDYHSRAPGPVRGALFNARAFWLYESVRSHPVSLVKGEWGARGSRALLRAFFDAAPEPPLVPLLRHLFDALGVAPRRAAAAGAVPDGSDPAAHAGAFLGAGGSARVFRVAAAGVDAAEPRALKASTTLSRAELEYEFTTLQRAAAAGAPVVPVVPGSLVFYVDEAGAHRGGGFLLRDVCAHAPLDSSARCAAAFASLRALHAAGFAHGDARLPNAVVLGRGAGAEFLWIDLRAAAAGALAAAQRADARALAASALGVAQGGALPAGVADALGGVPGGGAEAYAALARAVWGDFARGRTAQRSE